MSNFSQQANQVPRRTREGFVGQWSQDSQLKRYASGINKNPQAVNVWTFVVNVDPGDSVDFVLRFTFGDFVYDLALNTSTGLNTTTIADRIVAAINNNGILRGHLVASNSTNTVTLTGLTPGVGFTPSAPTNPSTMIASITETVAEALAADIEVGRAVVITGNNTSDAGTEPEYLVGLAAESLFSAQVITVAPTFVASAVIQAAVYEVRGGERHLIASAIFASATDLDTTIDGLVAALNTALPADSVVVTANNASATALVFTAEVLGLEFDVEFHHHSGGASSPTFTKTLTTGPSPATSIHRAWGGIALYTLQDEAALIGGTIARYPANHGVIFGQEGLIYVESAQSISRGDLVYVDLGTTNPGKLFNTSGADRVALARNMARWERDSRSTDNLNLAVVRLGPSF